jgi:hypothetical protein
MLRCRQVLPRLRRAPRRRFTRGAMRSTPPDASPAFLMHALTRWLLLPLFSHAELPVSLLLRFQFSAAAAALLHC